MIGREELFALADTPIGDADMLALANADFARKQALPPQQRARFKASPEVAALSRRAQKVWLPEGKSSANTSEQREHERALKAQNFDIEDAIEAAGGARGVIRDRCPQ